MSILRQIACDYAALALDGATSGAKQAGYEAQQCGLTSAIGTCKHDEVAVAELLANVAEHVALAITEAYVVDAEQLIFFHNAVSFYFNLVAMLVICPFTS